MKTLLTKGIMVIIWIACVIIIAVLVSIMTDRENPFSSKAGLDSSPPLSSPETSLYSQPQPIRVLQKTLMDLGYDCGEHAPDGVLGDKTLTSYREWDKKNCGFVLDYYKKNK